MQPLGRKPVNFPCKVDHHPPRGYINWWQNCICTENKTAEKNKSKKEIAKELNERIK